MKPETAAYLRKARELLDEAQTALSVPMIDHAGRAAYLAGFHAAQALLFEKTDTTPKTHGGVQGQFSLLVKDDARVDAELRGFLGRAYNLKAIADYETGPDSHVTGQQATSAIEGAKRLVAVISSIVSDSATDARDPPGMPGSA